MPPPPVCRGLRVGRGLPGASLYDLEEESFHFEQVAGYVGFVGDNYGPQESLRLMAALELHGLSSPGWS